MVQVRFKANLTAGTNRNDLTFFTASTPHRFNIPSQTLASGRIGESYSQQICGAEGLPPYSMWEMLPVFDPPPPGLTIAVSSPTCATISGTPTMADTFDFDVKAQDSVGVDDSRGVTIEIEPAN